MALVTLSTFTAGTAALASAVNANFDALKVAINGGLDATNLAALAVTEGKIADLAVATGKIADLAVATGKIADGAVTENKIGNLAVTEGKIGALAVTEGKIGALAVTNAKVATGIDAAKITTGTLPIARIADAAVTPAKASFYPQGGAVGGIFAFNVTAAGVITTLAGWSVSRIGEGVYAVYHPLSSVDFAVSITPMMWDGLPIHVYMASREATNFTYITRTEAGANNDAPVDILVVSRA